MIAQQRSSKVNAFKLAIMLMVASVGVLPGHAVDQSRKEDALVACMVGWAAVHQLHNFLGGTRKLGAADTEATEKAASDHCKHIKLHGKSEVLEGLSDYIYHTIRYMVEGTPC
jgi:hypothetical protein